MKTCNADELLVQLEQYRHVLKSLKPHEMAYLVSKLFEMIQKSDPKPSRYKHDRNVSIMALRESGLTLNAIGQQFGINGSRVRQIVEKERRLRMRRNEST